MEIIKNNYNAYKVTYMGYFKVFVLGREVKHGIPFYIDKEVIHALLNAYPISELDNIIYEEVIISSMACCAN